MIAFWLIPASDARKVLEALIAELAARCNAPTFEPHLTLGAGDVGPTYANEILTCISAREPVQLQIERIDFSDEYTKTLFVQFRSSPEIQRLGQEIQRGTGTNYELHPHLSLLYKEIPAAEKAELARTISLPLPHVRFETVKAITTAHPVKTSAQVEAWRTLGSRPLSLA